jgi:hypothetical protein
MEGIKGMHLIYINGYSNTSWDSKNIYEFLFTNDLESIDDASEEWGWSIYPASGNPDVPETKYVSVVGKLETELKFDLIQNSETFSVWDGIDGVVAIAFENLDDYEEYPEERMFFKYGDDMQSVIDKIYSRDEILKIDEIKNGESSK